MDGATTSPFPPRHELEGLLPGFRLAGKPLSQTGMSQVYLAKETKMFHREVVVKVMAAHLADDPTYRSRFRREIRVMAATLRHPNIIEIITASDPEAPLLYLVTPRADSDLRRLLSAGQPLDLARTVRIIEQVAAALDHAHDRGVIHRDVKPGNILLSGENGHVYLCDFGIAKETLGEPLTRTGESLGTPGYLPPELHGLPGTAGPAPEDPTPHSHLPAAPASDRTIDIYSLGAVLHHCLTGQPPFGYADAAAVHWAQQHGVQPRVSELRPDLPAALDQVVLAAMDPRPDRRYRTCADLVEALVRAAGPALGRPRDGGPSTGWAAPAVDRPAPPLRSPDRSWRPGRPAAVTAGVVAVAAVAAIAAIVIVPRLGGATGTPSAEQLVRIPEPLRGDCQVVEEAPGVPGASAVINCFDGDQQVTFSLFDQLPGMDSAYAEAVSQADIPRGSGDCTVATGAEHRYPAAGKPAGRVLCDSHEGTTSVVWTDDAARTVARASRRDTADPALEEAWLAWVQLPPYPTPDEQALVDLVELTGCHRPPAGSLETFRNLRAAVECDPPEEGANQLSYYQFADLDGLERTYHSRVGEVDAPPDVYCGDGSAPNFLGEDGLDLRSVDIGRMLCYRGPQEAPVFEWTFEPLLVMGRAVGTEPAELADWWRGYYGWEPPTAAISEAVNQRAQPAFPNPRERELLARIPAPSQVNCMRPPQRQIERNVRVDPVAALVCGPTRGASIVFYYQFDDSADLRADFDWNTDVSGADCTDEPPDFRGNDRYSRDSGSGRLACSMNDNGTTTLVWTDDRQKILAFAFQGGAPATVLDWWRSEAGPA